MSHIFIWLGMQDSNLRMHESKSCALPTWLIPSIYGERTGIRTPDTRLRRALLYPAELCTHIYWSGKRDSNSRLQPWQGCALPLNYSRVKNLLNGGTNRARTCDPLLVRQVLSQLSYGPGINKWSG